MNQIFKVFTILTPRDIRYCVFMASLMIAGAILEAIGIGAIFPLISIMGQPNYFATHMELAAWMRRFGIVSHEVFVMASAMALLLFYFAKNAFLVWQTRVQICFVLQRQVDYARALYAEYLWRPYIFHLNNNTATLLRNINDGPRIVFNYLLLPVLGLLTEVVTAIVIWGLLVLVDFFTATVVTGILGIFMYLIFKACRRNIERQGKVQKECVAVMNQWVNQGVGAIKETKILRKEAHFCTEYGRACKQYGKAFCIYNFLNQASRFLIETMIIAGLLLLIIVKIWNGETPGTIVPLLGVLALAAFRLMPCVNRILSHANAVKFNMSMLEELEDDLSVVRTRLMEHEHDMAREELTDRMAFSKAIVVDHLCFHYPGTVRKILSDVSFVIPKGSFVGIVGPSGAGKTTFVDLFLGLLEPDSGKILSDGINIYQDIRSWQANLAYVPQSIYLVDGTIRDNIALGVPTHQLDEQRIDEVLRMAELYEFVRELPEGLATTVGELGVKLSGGQRQRIGIARALYTKPEVLVLDEATSALDDATEKSITNTILKLKGRITIVAIAHRISTLANCDFKIRFENGCAEKEGVAR